MALTRRKLLSAGILAAPAVGLLDSFVIEPRWVQVTRHKVPVPGLPKALSGYRIAQITDLHLAGSQPAAWAAIAALAEVKPDAIALTGDIVEQPEDFPLLEKFLDALPKSCAKVASMGNWEHWSRFSIEDLRQCYADHGVELLVNQTATVGKGDKIALIGLDDPLGGNPRPQTAVEGSEDAIARIWLIHSPKFVDQLTAKPPPVDQPHLLLSGHTHGGQVRHPFGPIILPPGSGRFAKGWYRDTWAPLYVSRGVGVSVLPARFLCRPEVAVFELTRASTA